MNVNFKIYYKVVLLLLFAFALLHPGAEAQERTQNEEVTVEAPYEPSVKEANKLNLFPEMPDATMEKPEFTYEILNKTIESKGTPVPLSPAKITGESVPEQYKNFIKAGIGNYVTPLLELYAGSTRSRSHAYNFHFMHHSSSGKIRNFAYPGNSLTLIEGFGKKMLKEHILTATAGYKRKGIHYYGYKPDDFPEISLSKDDLRQHFNHFYLSTLFESNYADDEQISYFAGIDYSLLSDRYNTMEHMVRPVAGVNKNTDFFSFSEFENLGARLEAEIYFNNDKLRDYNNTAVVRFDPYYRFGFEQYRFEAGFKTAVEADSSSSFHFYPALNIEVIVVDKYLVTYAGIDGGLSRSSFKVLSDENPFMITYSERRFTNDKMTQYGGIRGKISRYFDYDLSFRNSTIENMPFFVNDTASVLGEGLNNQFAVVYDKVKYSRIIAGFGFHFKEKVDAILRGGYHNYFLDNEEKPWHKPTFDISLSVKYNMQDKIYMNCDLFTSNRMFARYFETVSNTSGSAIHEMQAELKGKFDLNLGAEYRYSKLLSGFIQLNNVIGQQYFRWMNYPSYRFNMMLGVSYSF
jgi:hypothetical protein